MRLRALPAALATLLTVVALAGCGSDQPADGTGPPPSTQPASAATSAPATTVVPAFTLGTSVDTVVVMLEQAGLVAEVPDVDYPHYAVATDPAAGVEVPVGTTVTVLVGDG